MKALVVDDDLHIRRITHYALTRANWTVSLAATGLEGIEKASEDYPDVILLDVMMPDLDGVSTLDILRSHPETAQVPVIFLTARTGELEVARLKAAGAIGLISKPFDPATLPEKIGRLLSPTVDTGGDQAGMEKLRSEFVRDVTSRLTELDLLIERTSEKGEPALLTEILIGFHHLSGAGGSYGFPAVSEIAGRGESEVAVFAREELRPSDEDRERWRALVGLMRRELDGSVASDAKPVHEGRELRFLIVDSTGDLFFDYAHRRADSILFLRAASHEEALQIVRTEPPDAVLVSLRMPGTAAGYEVIEQMRRIPGGHRLVIATVESPEALADRLKAIRSGVDTMFSWQSDPDSVIERLRMEVSAAHLADSRVLCLAADSSSPSSVETALAVAGHEVETCSDPMDLEARLIAFKPDVVLIDLALPGTTALELARFMRMHSTYAQISILFLAADGGTDEQREALRAGCEAYLPRPIAPPLLLDAVAACLKRSRFLRSLEGRDGLTGLLTHTVFLTRAESMVSERQRSESVPFVLMLLDIDDFANINDRFGPAAADQVLVSLSMLLRRRIRQSDLVGRYASRRFAALLRGLEIEEAAGLATRLLGEFTATGQNLRGGQVFTAAFTGALCRLESRHVRLTDWIRATEKALSYGESQGGNRIILVRDEEELETLFAGSGDL